MGASHSTPSREDEAPRLGLRRRLSTFIRGEPRAKRERSNSVNPPPGVPKRRRLSDSDDDEEDAPGQSGRDDVSIASAVASAGSSMRHISGPPRTLQSDADSSPAASSSAADERRARRARPMLAGPETLPSESFPLPAGPAASGGVERIMSRFRRNTAPTPPLSSGASSSSSTTSAAPSRPFGHRLSAIMGFASPERERPARAPSSRAPTTGASQTDTQSQAPDEPGGIPVGAVLIIQGLAHTHANVVEDGTTPRMDVESLDQQARMIGNLLTVAAAATATTLLSPERFNTQPSRSTAQNAMQTIIDRLRPQRNRPTNTIETALGEYLRNVLSDNRRVAEVVSGEAPESPNVPAEFQQFLNVMQDDLVRAVRVYAAGEGEEAEAETTTTEASAAAPVPAAGASPVAAPAEASAAPAPAVASVPTATPAPATAEPAETPSAIPSFHHQAGQNLSSAARTLGVTGGSEGVPRSLNFFRAHLFPSVQDGEGEEEALVPSILVGVRSIVHRPNMTTEELVAHPSFPFVDGEVPEPEAGVVVEPEPQPEPVQEPPATEGPLSEHIESFMEGIRESITSTGARADSDDYADYMRWLNTHGGGREPQQLSDEGVSQQLPPIQFPAHGEPFIPRPPPTRNPAQASASPVSSSAGSAPTARAPSPDPPRSFRERVLERLGARRPSARPQPPLNTYLIYVIGGNYPRSHPVLAIPSLISGGTLSAEDLALISELLGPAKPPTVSKEELDRAGLSVLKAADMAAPAVLESSMERCMVCLSDYEPDEDVRVLSCRHAFHSPCVDQWLTEGRNSCPTCRTEAVDRAALKTPPTPPVEDATLV